MGGLVIDIVVAYLFKSAVRVFHFFRSYNWRRTKASFTDWTVENPDLGCSSVEVHYRFASKEGSATGSDEIPFYMRWHAKTYAESLSRDLRPVIRVNPRNAHETQFFELDQRGRAPDNG